ncbi:recQ family helicase [Fusarium napiforme]|uniref:DNA 3'-5' helicase n=1 Tax=Fusarium napiforme TaxID=42672 RepID=A0A8H5IWH0_9HYPO|nr:recQ family helicase [Fusarium napiforme]
MTLTTRGKSFVHTNRSLVNKEVEMLEDLIRSPRAAALLDQKGMFKEKGEGVYRKLVKKFEGLLLLLCHFTGGQPSRGPEILGLRLANGITRDRSVFIIDGQVVLVTQYHKSLAHFDAPKVIPRFLPARVGQLLAMYMVYIRPFVDRLEADRMDRYGEMRAPSDFIWQTKGDPWQSPEMSSIMGKETQHHLGYKITIQHWRHIAIAISKKHARRKAGMQADFDEGDEDEEYDPEDQEQYEEPDDIAAGHTSRVAEHYGVTMDIVKRLSAESLRVFKQVSHRWHVFLGCAPPRLPRGRMERKGKETGDIAKPSCQVDVIAGEDGEMDDSIRQALCKALGDPAAEFRSEQQERAIHCATKGLSPLVVILPTGGGKSLVFMVPALLPDAGITIVVTPYKLLKEQLVPRCQNAGIHCQMWPEARTTFPRVTVVSAEAAVTDSFLQWAAELSSKGRLDRVVIDECHVVITAGETYRSKLRELVRLRDLGRPCIFMTGTLPPSRQHDFEQAMLLSTPLYIRSSSHRTTMRYSVLRVANGKDITEVLRLVRARQARMKPGERGIVFCDYYAKCQAVSKQLHCFWYHALRGDEESHRKVQRDQGFRDWVAGSGNQYIAATSAMGTGLDFPGVTHIIHLGHPYSLIDYAQETGRGGRGGEAVDADMIITEGDWPSEDEQTDKSTVPDRRYVNMFIRTKGCRRAQLGLYLDGDPQDCSRIDAIPCDNCLGAQQVWQSETPGEVYQAAKRRRQEDAAAMEHIVAALEGIAELPPKLACRYER